MKNINKEMLIVIVTIIMGSIVFFYLIYPNKEGPSLNFGISILSGLILYLYIILTGIVAGRDYSKIREKYFSG